MVREEAVKWIAKAIETHINKGKRHCFLQIVRHNYELEERQQMICEVKSIFKRSNTHAENLLKSAAKSKIVIRETESYKQLY